MKYLVCIEWNTNADGSWFDRNVEYNEKDVPKSYYGAFDNFEDALYWSSNSFPDDTDVWDVYIKPYRWWRHTTRYFGESIIHRFFNIVNAPIDLHEWYDILPER